MPLLDIGLRPQKLCLFFDNYFIGPFKKNFFFLATCARFKHFFFIALFPGLSDNRIKNFAVTFDIAKEVVRQVFFFFSNPPRFEYDAYIGALVGGEVCA